MAYTVTLSSGHKMPILGLGTWQSKLEEVRTAVHAALNAGYRHIDTAFNYLNEESIGDALQEYFKQGKLKREDLFITTKLAMTFMNKDEVVVCFTESLRRLRLDYVDLYLIHAPVAMQYSQNLVTFRLENQGDWTTFPVDENGKYKLQDVDLVETWRAMEVLVDSGKVRSIGLSNFNSEQTERIYKAARHKPVTNQVECHAYFPQYKLQEFCEKRNIRLTAFSPLGTPGRPKNQIKEGSPVLLEEAILKDIGNKYDKTPAQVLIRNLIQRGMIVIPKSINPQRIKENFQVFDFTLTEEDIDEIKKLDCNERLLMLTFGLDYHEYPFNIPF